MTSHHHLQPRLRTSGAKRLLPLYAFAAWTGETLSSLTFLWTRETHFDAFHFMPHHLYRGADKSLARPGRKQANVSVRMAWISFGALPCRKEKKTWQLASRCCCNSARPWHASEFVSFLVALRTYQHPGTQTVTSYEILKFIATVCRIVRKRLMTYSREVMFTSADSIWRQVNQTRTQRNFQRRCVCFLLASKDAISRLDILLCRRQTTAQKTNFCHMLVTELLIFLPHRQRARNSLESAGRTLWGYHYKDI